MAWASRKSPPHTTKIKNANTSVPSQLVRRVGPSGIGGRGGVIIGGGSFHRSSSPCLQRIHWRRVYTTRLRLRNADECVGLCPKCLDRFAWAGKMKLLAPVPTR